MFRGLNLRFLVCAAAFAFGNAEAADDSAGLVAQALRGELDATGLYDGGIMIDGSLDGVMAAITAMVDDESLTVDDRVRLRFVQAQLHWRHGDLKDAITQVNEARSLGGSEDLEVEI